MIVLDVVLMAGIAAVIVGLLTWSICTQHREAGCAHLRIRRRLQVRVKLVTHDRPATHPRSQIAA